MAKKKISWVGRGEGYDREAQVLLEELARKHGVHYTGMGSAVLADYSFVNNLLEDTIAAGEMVKMNKKFYKEATLNTRKFPQDHPDYTENVFLFMGSEMTRQDLSTLLCVHLLHVASGKHLYYAYGRERELAVIHSLKVIA